MEAFQMNQLKQLELEQESFNRELAQLEADKDQLFARCGMRHGECLDPVIFEECEKLHSRIGDYNYRIQDFNCRCKEYQDSLKTLNIEEQHEKQGKLE